MAYLKPQAPLMQGADYVYPITTADQVVLSDGSRFEKNGVATAQDSEKLGGKAPGYYLSSRNLLDNSDFEITGAGAFGIARWDGNDGAIDITDGIVTFSAG